mmetsp:Transcript_15426/g.39762  ORF Transcript_15426/g.39762 Transcript_15426/m.39762 type:complete len:203 (-) Transcript_15426:202-810(-)
MPSTTSPSSYGGAARARSSKGSLKSYAGSSRRSMDAPRTAQARSPSTALTSSASRSRTACTAADGVPWSTTSTLRGMPSSARCATSMTWPASARPTRWSDGSCSSTRHAATRRSNGASWPSVAASSSRLQSAMPRRSPPLGPRKSGTTTAPGAPLSAIARSSARSVRARTPPKSSAGISFENARLVGCTSRPPSNSDSLAAT